MTVSNAAQIGGARRKQMLAFTAILAAFLIGWSGLPAQAIAYGTYSYKTVASISYKGRAAIDQYPSGTGALATVFAGPTNKPAPAGYIGRRPGVFTSSGANAAAGAWSYSTSTTSVGSTPGAGVRYAHSGTYYARGDVRYYNGSSYESQGMTKSPNQNVS